MKQTNNIIKEPELPIQKNLITLQCPCSEAKEQDVPWDPTVEGYECLHCQKRINVLFDLQTVLASNELSEIHPLKQQQLIKEIYDDAKNRVD